jgi:phosphatidylglycerol:prolipoprotein diacylglycerol transferase
MFPEIQLSDSISIPTYLLFLSLLYCFLIFYVYRRAESRSDDLKIALDLALILMVAGFLGGRLLHVFYEAPQYYALDWTRVFQFWQGGFVFYGGFLLAIVACLVYVHYKKVSFIHWADFFAPVMALGYGLGRISCFLAGCCYGRACDMPWALQFPWDPERIWRHPTQIYAAVWELGVFGILILMEKRRFHVTRPGEIFFFWVFMHGIGRLVMEYYRDDFRGSLIAGMTISTWISLSLMSFAGCYLAFHSQRKIQL